MLVPVVFLVLPTVVLVALYPGGQVPVRPRLLVPRSAPARPVNCSTTEEPVLTRISLPARRTSPIPPADERGDVPGWVLVAVMTAGLVTALWLVADGQLTAVLQRAITSVTKP